MRYMGGKHRLAPYIVSELQKVRGSREFWDPFCGGLSVAVRLAEHGSGVVSDYNPALITLYQAVRDGWDPPNTISEEEYAAARNLPDTDPLKAFVGFGCTYGGKWFGGYARKGNNRNYADEARRALLRDIPKLVNCSIEHKSFFDVRPQSLNLIIYCDPPYDNTTKYAKTDNFDSARFWFTCMEWAKFGVPVFVSEYSCPVPHKLVWERSHSLCLAGGSVSNARIEKLFQVI